MKRHTLFQFVLLIILATSNLLISCSKDDIKINQIGPVEDKDVDELKNVIKDKYLDKINKLNKASSIILNWNSIQKLSSNDTITMFYIEIQEFQENNKLVKPINYKKVIRIAKIKHEFKVSQLTYIYKNNDNIFTGSVTCDDFDNNKQYNFEYIKGKYVKQKLYKKSHENNSTTQCYQYITCQWKLYCTDINTGTVTILPNAMTSGTDYCEEPSSTLISPFCTKFWTERISTRIEFICPQETPNYYEPIDTDPYGYNSTEDPNFPYTTIPCPGDPLRKMSIAPSNGWNYKGGTYGVTRNSGKKWHKGLDIKGDLNEDCYSMYPGKVIKITANFPPYPNAEGKDYAPAGWAAFGNTVTIESVVNNETIYITYAHLNGINPNIQIGSQVSDRVKIGIIGRTGNAASDGTVPHVHIDIRKDKNLSGIPVDPEPYVATKFDHSTGLPINKPCF